MTRSPGVRAILGLVILATVMGLGYLGTRAAQGAFAEDYRFTVLLGETGQGLVQGSDVAFRGVLIGKVGEISLTEDLQAEVELVLEPQYEIPASATFAVVGKTLFGEKQLEVRYDGDPADAVAFIEDGGRVSDVAVVTEVQDVLEDLDVLLAAINPDDLAVVINDGAGAFVGQEDSIARAIDQGARATGVFAGSLDDQVPALRDLSLVAEALGPVGDEFNRLGTALDNGALDTLTANQQRLRVLLAELNEFSDQLDVVLELTRADLDRMIIQGDNVTRVLFAYRPEVAELVEGINDYTDTIGNGGQTDPGFDGFAAGFAILVTNPITAEFCGQAPPELAAILPLCGAPEGGEGAEAPAAAPAPPVPVAEVPVLIAAGPQAPADTGVEAIIDAVLSDLAQVGGAR